MTSLLENVTKIEFDHTKPFAKLKQNDLIARLNVVNERITKGSLVIPEEVCRHLEWCTKKYLILKECELKTIDLDFSDLLPLLRENRDGYYDQVLHYDSNNSGCDSDCDSTSTSTPLASNTTTSCYDGIDSDTDSV